MRQGDLVKFKDCDLIGVYQESLSPWIKYSETSYRYITDKNEIEKITNNLKNKN